MPAAAATLPHGIAVEPLPEGRLRISFPGLELPLAAGRGRLPGTAVVWQGEMYEVVERQASAATLAPWPEGAAARQVLRLDAASVESLAKAREEQRRRDETGRRLTAMLPVTGLAPGWLQERWAREFGFPDITAVLITASTTVIAGMFGLIQALVLAFRGDWFLPGPLRWWVFAGPVLAVEGVLRIYLALFQDRPAGSLLAMPAWPFLARLRPRPRPLAVRPVEARLCDAEGGLLVLASDARRDDWPLGGVLSFRGKAWRLDEAVPPGPSDRVGSAPVWQYRFAPARDGDASGPPLRLAPPARTAPPPPGIGRMAVRAVAYAFAPTRFQEDWAGPARVSPRTLTLAAGAVEAFGGLINLASGDGGIWTFLDVLVAGEGLLRVAAAVLGRPLGSVLGWPLTPLFERWRRELRDDPARDRAL